MDTSYYIIASLLGAVLMVVEHGIARARGIAAYRFDDTVNSLSHFIGELVLTAVLYLNVFYGYHLLESRVGVFSLAEGHVLTWVLSFVALDLVYYVGHRACHRVGALWALHTVHHQSNEYNLAVGMRGPMLSALQIAPFMLPLAFCGVPSSVLFPLYAAHTVWKLLVHTRVVGKLGPLEHFLVTPSQHRVHHAHNDSYLDKNFGGVFNIWDRMFGTFVVEDEAPVFGPAQALQNLDPIHNNLEPWRQIAQRARGRGLRGWVRALLGPPQFEDAVTSAATVVVEHQTPSQSRAVLVLRLAGAGVITMLMLQFAERVPIVVGAAVGIAVLTVLARVGRALSPRRSALGTGVHAASQPLSRRCESPTGV